MKRKNYELHPHAQQRAKLRGVPSKWIDAVMAAPAQKLDGVLGRKVYQSKFFRGTKEVLLRAFVDERRNPKLVISVYITDRIAKYGSK